MAFAEQGMCLMPTVRTVPFHLKISFLTLQAKVAVALTPPVWVHSVVLEELALLANLKETTGAWGLSDAGAKVEKPLMVGKHAVFVRAAGRADTGAEKAERARIRMLKVYMVIE